MNIKYQSIQGERSESGRSDTVTYYGTREEMTALMEEQQISPASSGRKVVSAAVSQSDGDLWQCEIRYQNTLGNLNVSAPDDSYGKKSAQLSCGMLSMPLESHPDYRANWNYYLGARDDVLQIPAWWKDAKNLLLEGDDAEKFKWIKSVGELPPGKDADGRTWRIMAEPQKPGMESYDVATYQVTESAKFPSPARAGKMICGKLNRISSPDQTFGITGGNWKCDSASVSWNGKYWIATLSYTRSGNAEGWDGDLYGGGKS